VSFGFVKKEIFPLLSGNERRQPQTTTEEDGWQEHLSLKRVEPIVVAHMYKQMMDIAMYGSNPFRGPSHPDWLAQRNRAFVDEHFFVAEAGPDFINAFPDGSPRRMLTLFAKKSMRDGQCPDFFYEGALIDSLDYQDGSMKQLAFRTKLKQPLWLIPPIEFNVDNKELVHPAHLLHQTDKVAHFSIASEGRVTFIRQRRAFEKDERLFLDYGYSGRQEWGAKFVDLYPGRVAARRGVDVGLDNDVSDDDEGENDDGTECLDESGEGSGTGVAAAIEGGLVVVGGSDDRGRDLRSSLRGKGSSGGSDSAGLAAVRDMESDCDYRSGGARESMIDIDLFEPFPHDGIFFVVKKIAKSIVESRKKEWVQNGKNDAENFDDYSLSLMQASRVREDICKRGYYVLDKNTQYVQDAMTEMLANDVGMANTIESDPSTIFEPSCEFLDVFEKFLTSEQVMLQMGWRNSNMKRGKEFDIDTTDRWCNALNDNELFAKYVYRMDPVVQKLHALLFPPSNRRASSKLSQPTIHLAIGDADPDIVPTCFSSANDIVYVFHFPTIDTSPTYGIYEGSVANMCAMQGAMDMCNHLPPCLQNLRVPMTNVAVGDYGILILDSRTLFARMQIQEGYCTIVWTAKGLHEKHINLICQKEPEEEIFRLKPAFHKNFVPPRWEVRDRADQGKQRENHINPLYQLSACS
jgi:hypothetical protein